MMSMSTAEAEYIALAHTMQTAKIVQKLVHEVALDTKDKIPLWSDNEAAMQMTKNHAGSKRRKLIDLRHASLRITHHSPIRDDIRPCARRPTKGGYMHQTTAPN